MPLCMRNITTCAKRAQHSAGWSSMVARRAHNPEVVGSNPAPATTKTAGQTLVWPAFLLLGIAPSHLDCPVFVQFSLVIAGNRWCSLDVFARKGARMGREPGPQEIRKSMPSACPSGCPMGPGVDARSTAPPLRRFQILRKVELRAPPPPDALHAPDLRSKNGRKKIRPHNMIQSRQ